MAKLTLGVNIEGGKMLFDFHNGIAISPVDAQHLARLEIFRRDSPAARSCGGATGMQKAFNTARISDRQVTVRVYTLVREPAHEDPQLPAREVRSACGGHEDNHEHRPRRRYCDLL